MIGGLAAALLAPASVVHALSRRVVTDPVTGFAAGGYDAVAYFVDGRAREGRAGFEAIWADVAWRFANEGNRAAFLEAPDVYAPSFGGHCAVSVSRGYLAEADPRIWAVERDRLYFFHSRTNQRIFSMDPDGIVQVASAQWTRLMPW